MRAHARRAALEVAWEAALELLDGRLGAAVVERSAGEAELVRALGEERGKLREDVAARRLQVAAEGGDLRRPRRDASRGR